jgi:hypothetical protein
MNSLLTVALNNKRFMSVYKEGLSLDLIRPFDDNIFNKMKGISTNFNCNLYEYFINGYNVGMCGLTVELLFKMFGEGEKITGVLPAIAGSKRSPKGEHAWLLVNGLIIDPSLMIIVDNKISGALGYRANQKKKGTKNDRIKKQ